MWMFILPAALLWASAALSFGGHVLPADDFPIAELQYKDYSRFYYLHSPYGFVAKWENGKGRFYLYDKGRTDITTTEDLQTFVGELSKFPDGSEVAWVNTCAAPLHYLMPKANLAKIERVLKRKRFKMAQIKDNNFILCTCESTNLVFFTQARVTDSTAQTSTYPAQWWAPVSKEGAPAWEIFPQQAGPGEVILSKRNELGLLSNFAPTPFTFHGKRYASLEGFWQMMKYPEGPDDPRAKFSGLTWPHTREEVSQMTGFEANWAGKAGEDNMKKMAINWVTFEGRQMGYRPKEPGDHYRLILEATREKVRQNPEVKKVLLATGNLVLKPDHHQETNAPAAWRYYEILMMIRGELQHQL